MDRTYKAEYSDGNFELFSFCGSFVDAVKEAIKYEQGHGSLSEVFEVNENSDMVIPFYRNKASVRIDELETQLQQYRSNLLLI